MTNLKTSFEIPYELAEAIKDNNLVLFIGAGLSSNLVNKQNSKIGNWKNLVDSLIVYLRGKGYDLSEIKEVEEGKELEALQIIENDQNIPLYQIINFAKSFYDLANDNDLTLHRKLLAITDKIITTNYDNAFELSQNEPLINVAYKGKDHELASIPMPREKTLFKLHGCISDGNKMILIPKVIGTYMIIEMKILSVCCFF